MPHPPAARTRGEGEGMGAEMVRAPEARPSAPALRAQAALVWEMQAALLAFYCRLDAAARKAADDELDAREARELLREARRWLGPGVGAELERAAERITPMRRRRG